ncbi:ankyrin [Mytilinidion resinicola]|uniref:protein S-acyltransferase n=1 Tax=Mytilinidion resinicola TaxID=574789 RepID=A0A6A6YVK5_9PEZI|nr:ankyrin [Mytilinidion resinicola]KAF2812982.1 ankyrin [Mytilinidion resinicola]
MTRRNIPRANNYSYGLVIWSVLLYSGDIPSQRGVTSRQQIALQELENNKDAIGSERYSVLHGAVSQCLEPEPLNRAMTLLPLFPDGETNKNRLVAHAEEISASQWDERAGNLDLENLAKLYDPFRKPKYESWEPNPFASYYAKDLLSSILHGPRIRTTVSDATVLSLLCNAASLGAKNAQSMIGTIHRYYEIDQPEEIQRHYLAWLKRAVADGSVLGKSELQKLDHDAFSASIEQFQNSGGYNWFYFHNNERIYAAKSDEPELPGWTTLHRLAACGTVEQMGEYLETPAREDIESLTSNGETALYLASARGCWAIAKKLLDYGADPARPCTTFGITCLHWLFCFDENFQDEAVAHFFSRGADIDATARDELPFWHYPFVLPAGTPLHWAVVTSSRVAISALFNHGADVLVRDGSNPYTFDSRVRFTNKFGGPNQEPYSVPEIKPMGLSSLDLSAMQWDPFLFHLIRSSRKQTININAVDEEGFAVLHRHSADYKRRTRLGNVFSSVPFRGTREEARQGLRQIAEIVQELGGNFDLLTTTTTSKSQSYRFTDMVNQTPLMLAMTLGDVDIVEALLDYGANPNAEDEQGAVALHYLPTGNDKYGIPCVELLLSRGADVNHRRKLCITVTPVIVARRSPGVVDTLLSNGANMEDIDESVGSSEYGRSLWTSLAERDKPLECVHDNAVAGLLEKHVLSLSDADRIQNIINYANQDGLTMLHQFARRGMHLSTSTILRHRADPNKLYCRQTYEFHGKDRMRVTFSSTPLDLAIEELARRERQVRSHKEQYSRLEYKDLCDKDRAVIEALRRFGGTCSEVPKLMTPVD